MQVDVLVIGAGPSGSIISALLQKQGINSLVVEKEQFPRFVIGESLLPFCMHAITEAGFLNAVLNHQEKLGFQFKNGAAFTRGKSNEDVEYRYFDFSDKSSAGFGTTFQVRRAEFDSLLIDEAVKQGVCVKFGVAVENFDWTKDEKGYVSVGLSNGETLKAKFIVDASGYGRVLPQALDLETPSFLPPRMAIFTHIQDNIQEVLYDRNKILIITHPQFEDVWFWLIPFSDGRCSIGIVGEEKYLLDDSKNLEEILKSNVYQAPMLKRLLGEANWDTPVRKIKNYSANVKTLCGENFALLGNAGEFLDPVFSSGVTIAMYSATLLAPLLGRLFKGEKVDLFEEYVKPLNVGIDTFKTYVSGWYDKRFQEIIYTKKENHQVKRQICSILAGYAWDTQNPYVYKSNQALSSLFEILSEK